MVKTVLLGITAWIAVITIPWIPYLCGNDHLVQVTILWGCLFLLMMASWHYGKDRAIMGEAPMFDEWRGLEQSAIYELMGSIPFRHKGRYSIFRHICGRIIPEHGRYIIVVKTLVGLHPGRIRIVISSSEPPAKFYWTHEQGIVVAE